MLLLDVWKAIHVRQGKVISDEICTLYPVENFTANHIWYVEARGINVPFLRPLLSNQSYCARKQGSTDKEFWTDCVRMRAWLLLWPGQWEQATWESIR